MAFPPPPSKHIDWDHLEFKIREVNGHIESRYDQKTQKWSEPELVSDPYLKIHGLSPALNYGQQAYEGLKAYRNPEGKINIFRPDKHARRLEHSTSFVSIPGVPEEHFIKCIHLAVSLNAVYVPPHYTNNSCLYIRPVVFGSGAHLGLTPPSEYIFCVYVQPIAAYHGVNALDALVMEEFDRAAPKGTGSAKVGGNYAPVIRWSDKARAEGYGITLHLDSRTGTEIDEFSTSGFIGVKVEGDQTTLVSPDSRNIIFSITSDSCMTLARSFGWKTEKRPIKYDEIGSFSEVFAVGTAASVVPIRSIKRISTLDKFSYLEHGSVGPCFTRLSNALQAIQLGKVEDKFGWLEEVHEAANFKERSAAADEVGHTNGVTAAKGSVSKYEVSSTNGAPSENVTVPMNGLKSQEA